MAKVRANNTDPKDYEALGNIISGGRKAPRIGAKGYDEELARRNKALADLQNKDPQKKETEVEAKKREMINAGGDSNAIKYVKNEEQHNKVRTSEGGPYGSPVKKNLMYKKK